MKAPVARFPRGAVLDRHRLLPRRQLVEALAHALRPCIVAAPHRVAQRIDLDMNAQPRDRFQIVDRHRRDAKPALPFGHDQRIADEPRERLAQRAGPDAVHVLQVFDAQLRAGRVMPFDDVLPELVIRMLAERAGMRFGVVGEGGAFTRWNVLPASVVTVCVRDDG